jgi:Xaa-Pro aminopeptidase
LKTDPDFLTQTLREKIEGYGVKLQMNKSPIIEQRTIKNPEEISKIRVSQRLNKEVYKKIVPYLQEGVTEEEIARRIQILQLELGASGPSFPPIVAF